MSYILEALKKAQAERQLGSAPTLHAPALYAGGAKVAGPVKKPLLWLLLAMTVAIAVLLVLVLRPTPTPTPTPAPTLVASMPVKLAVALPSPTAAPASAPAPAPALAAVLPSVAPAPRHSDAETPQPPAPTPAKAAPAPVSAPAAGEPVQQLRDLPEPIQRAIPRISVGGYIYSSNPADRLLLIDKVLRHEGEEVAPGLILEALQPHQAVFHFQGYRYRIPY